MEDIIDLTKENPGTPIRQTPISNDIKQFLTPTAAARATPSSVRMNTSTPVAASAKPATPSSTASAATNKSSTGEKEKKNCKIKKTELDEDIEILELDSDEEQENVVPESAAPTTNQSQPSATTGGGTAHEVFDVSDYDDDIIAISTPQTDAPKKNKMQKIKHTQLDYDIDIIEEDESGNDEVIIQEQRNTAETPSELQLIHEADAANDDDRITTPITRDLSDTPIPERPESVKSNAGADNNKEAANSHPAANPSSQVSRPRLPPLYSPEKRIIQHEATDAQNNDSRMTTPVLNNSVIAERSENVKSGADNHEGSNSRPTTSPRVPRRRTPAPSSRDIERRKLQPDQYKFGVTKNNVENRRIIVPLQDNPNFVHEYSHSNNNYWYCRFCALISKEKARVYAIMRGDKTFDALVHHICPLVTAEQSEKEQERIKTKYSRKRTARESSIFSSGGGYELEEEATPRTTRSRPVNYCEGDDSSEEDLNLSAGSVNGGVSVNPVPISRDIERRKLQPDQYKFGVTKFNTKNGRIIVPVENDPIYVHEYTHNHLNFWYCRLCSSALKNKQKGSFAILNDDGTFDAVFHHICQPITAVESQKEQDRIKTKYSSNNSRKRASLISSADDDDYEPEEVYIPRRKSRSRAVNYRDGDDSFEEDLNQIGRTLKREVHGNSRRSIDRTSMREVPRSEWVFGFNRAGQKDKRIVVFESNDRTRATEYGIYEYQIRCLGCNRKNQSYNHGRFDPEKELLFIPINHVCAPKSYSEIEEEQKMLEQRYNAKSSGSFGSSRSKRPRMDNSESMRHESTTPVNLPNDERHESPVNVANNSAEVKTDWHDFLVPPSPPSRVNSVQPQIIPAADLPFTTPSPPLSEQSDSPLPDSSIARFYHPSGLFLSHCCESLDLTYSPEAYSFWANIEVYDFNLNSVHQNVHQTVDREMSGFSALSLLLTGSESSAMTIKCNLNTYILQNCDVIGDMVRHDLSKSTNPKLLETFAAKNPTEMHFVAMTRLFDCRFAIFKDGSCKRYGNWNPAPEYIPIFLLQFQNGRYSPIMSF